MTESTCACPDRSGQATPRPVTNDPALPAVGYRVADHPSVKASLLAGLAGHDVPAMATLGARDDGDLTIALADGFAVMADILTFYTERIANEAYLRTATERRSVVELARLLGYQPDPGVAADAHLAFTLAAPLTRPAPTPVPVPIPIGTKVQSVPGPEETPVTFETVAGIEARAEWNAIAVQTWREQEIGWGRRDLVLAGTGHRLEPGDAIVLVGAERAADPGSERWDVRVLTQVSEDVDLDITRLRWEPGLGSTVPPGQPAAEQVSVLVFRQRAALFGHNAPDPRTLSTTGTQLASLADVTAGTWNDYALSGSSIDLDLAYPKITRGSWLALIGGDADPDEGGTQPNVELYRADAVTYPSLSRFGLSGKVTRIELDSTEHLTGFDRRSTLVLAQSEALALGRTPVLAPVFGTDLVLDGVLDGLAPGQPLAVSGPSAHLRVALPNLELVVADGTDVPLAVGDRLELLAAPDRSDGAGGRQTLTPDEVEEHLRSRDTGVLHWRVADRDGRVGDLDASGRALLLDPATDADPVNAEVVHLVTTADAVTPGRDTTLVKLGTTLTRTYDRRRVRVNANVAPATHGETVGEILGSGEATRGDQAFRLTHTPLTWVGADTETGRAAALDVLVDDTRWNLVPTLYAAAPQDRSYTVRTQDDGRTVITFGDGREGARLPTGQANVRARYRTGLGRAGNVRSGQLSTLLTRPLGVLEVTNPQPGTGGEDPETAQQAAANAPATVLTLGRVVSRRDAEDYARSYPGIAKALARWVPTGPNRGVAITVIGVDGAEVPPGSTLHGRLLGSLRDVGDPGVSYRVHSAVTVTFSLVAGITVDPAHEPDAVAAAVATQVLAAFGFEARDLGRSVGSDEVVAAIHQVPGVLAVDLDELRRPSDPPGVMSRMVPSPGDADGLQPAELLLIDPAAVTIEVRP